MTSFAFAFVISLVLSGLIVRLACPGNALGGDDDLSGVQKCHARPVPRAGGFAIALAGV